MTIDNSVEYIPQNEHFQSISRDRDSKPKTIKNNSLPRKQNKKLSQNSKNFIAKALTEAFKLVK